MSANHPESTYFHWQGINLKVTYRPSNGEVISVVLQCNKNFLALLSPKALNKFYLDFSLYLGKNKLPGNQPGDQP